MTLTIQRFEDPDAFFGRAGTWLLRSESEHNLLLGLLRRLQAHDPSLEGPLYLATVEAGDDVVGCAFRTPPFKLGLTRMPADALPLLVDDVRAVYPELPAVMGPEPEARLFAEHWAAATGGGAREGMRQRIYELERVIPPDAPPPGRLRRADRDDFDLVADWVAAFTREADIGPRDPRRAAREKLTAGELWLWENGASRSMAAEVARTPRGVRIGYVYTPPEWRGQGYASACVAALSQELLDSGRRFCFLYTDLANPTSNAIYPRIGYRPVGEVVDYELDAGDDP